MGSPDTLLRHGHGVGVFLEDQDVTELQDTLDDRGWGWGLPGKGQE